MEREICELLHSHPHIVEFKGIHEDGILLGYACHGSIGNYLQLGPNPSTPNKLRWCLQAVSAVSYLHKKKVIHCDISVWNILLDVSIR